MARVVALLRGVNLGGRKLAMSDLRAVCEAAGCEEVQTYIASGNAVFTHSSAASSSLRADLERRLKKVAGFEVPVVLRTAKEIDAVVRANPFDESDGTKLHVAFLNEKPKKTALDEIDLEAFSPEAVAVKGREAYFHLPNGLGVSKLAPKVLPKLMVSATMRNWNTVLKLQELANSTK